MFGSPVLETAINLAFVDLLWLIFGSAIVVLLRNIDTVEITKRVVADVAFRESLNRTLSRRPFPWIPS